MNNNKRQLIMYYQDQPNLNFFAMDLGNDDVNDNRVIIDCQNEFKSTEDVYKEIHDYTVYQNITSFKDVKIIFDSKNNLSYVVNLSKMSSFKVKKAALKELESIFGNLNDYEIIMDFNLNDKNYFNVYCILILKSELKYVKEILKLLKIKKYQIILKSDLYKKYFPLSNFITFESGNKNVLLGMGHNNDYKSILIENFGEFKYAQALNTLLTYFKISKEDFETLKYFYVDVNNAYTEVYFYDFIKRTIKNDSIEKIDFFSTFINKNKNLGTKI